MQRFFESDQILKSCSLKFTARYAWTNAAFNRCFYWNSEPSRKTPITPRKGPWTLPFAPTPLPPKKKVIIKKYITKRISFQSKSGLTKNWRPHESYEYQGDHAKSFVRHLHMIHSKGMCYDVDKYFFQIFQKSKRRRIQWRNTNFFK